MEKQMEEQFKTEKGFIKGELIRMIYHNEDEHFSIALIHIVETNESIEESEIVVKGHFTRLDEKEHYIFYGDLIHHPKFGEQYNVEHYQKEIPTSKEGVVLYLSSDLFYGIGKRTAERIVGVLGEQAIPKILQDPSVLQDVPYMKQEKADQLVADLKEHQGFEHIVISLSEYGFGLQMAQKIYETYQDRALEILQENPYQFVFDINGFGFKRADEVAAKHNIAFDHPTRIQAACLYTLNEWSQQGNVFAPYDVLVEEVQNVLNNDSSSVTSDVISREINQLAEEEKLIQEEGNIYLPSLYYAESGFAEQLHRLLMGEVEEEYSQAELMKVVGEIEDEEEISYGKEQFDAIEKALHSNLMILTGGPGTGKTTVIKGIVTAYAKLNRKSLKPADYDAEESFPFLLTAPTGRAAKRMNESTGIPAVTIHRLLGWNGGETFERDQDHQLDGKILIIDEFSMVDIWLANQLFRAIPSDMQVLLVGDEDQLPSVGPGQVLSDLLTTNLIPATQLQEVYRQKEGSKIIQLAHDMKQGRCNAQSLAKAKDFNFISCVEHQVLHVIQTVYEKAMEKGHRLKDIQILAPMYRSKIGIHRLNQEIQQLANPPSRQKREMKTKEVIYRTGDKVIQLVNQPESGVYNGDIGEIAAIFKEDETKEQKEKLVVSFEGKEVEYSRKDLTQLMHAYCTSIHKSQGSEFSIVILPVVRSYSRMLRRNLLYTAVTRSKRSLIICGDEQAFRRGVETVDTNRRYTSLHERMDVLFNQIPTDDNENEEELSPYDFM
ncbi:ATP-dependent RecD-like DNA helicase [Pontibacillus yanchengensis]|uniref:ATP-dependent RecD2 DNA helicase n=2 Tax=Pontibacillus yanchengensis TaxID=462910 RepID=A0A6I4ZT56_9BACI|nr:ATP-dependent RecD-like DNA helicase [Pontibacillus yanchengensis]MYL33368.1 ATP-dependent RecD-like DNA helicase [Pontibacillus yanchengensis]MYL53418.1 ATP-dependent RecD-like DNA helicase [Pontibacillus yanchengensis]